MNSRTNGPMRREEISKVVAFACWPVVRHRAAGMGDLGVLDLGLSERIGEVLRSLEGGDGVLDREQLRVQLKALREDCRRWDESSQKMRERVLGAVGRAGIGIWEWDLASGKMVWNDHHARILGLNDGVGTVTGTGEGTHEVWLERMHPEDRGEWLARVERVKAEGGRVEHCFRVVQTVETIRWVRSQGECICDENGKVVRIHGTVQDVTEEMRGREVAESEERYRTLVEHADVMLVRFDRQMRHVFVNRATERATGMRREDLLGKTIGELGVELALCELWDQNFQKVFETGKPSELTFTWESPSGAKNYRARLVPERDEKGEVGSIMGMVHDVTEEVTAEAERDAIHRRLSALMDALPVGVSFSEDARCERITANREGLKQFEVRPEENLSKTAPDENAPGRKVKLFFKGRELPGDELPMQRAVSERRVIPPMELEIVLPSGKRWWADASGAPIYDQEGRLVGGVAVCVDVTQRKEAERAIREAKEEAERANAAKDHFLAVLSHELRTPLTPVLTTAEFMEGDETLSADHREMWRMVRRNVELEARLIDDMLDMTRVVRNKLELRDEVLDVHEKVGHVLRICSEGLGGKRLKVSLELEAERHQVRGDSARVQQILWNVLNNAIKFTPEGGAIAIRTANDADGILVRVRDTGIGIDGEALPHIFEAFEQGGRAVTSTFGGLGLGLAISKALAERHGGMLSAESEGKGKGATFTLRLPTNGGVQGQGVDRHRRTGGNLDCRVLLVEDHEDTRRAMVRVLEQLGCVVKAAESMREALELVRGEKFDVVISDIGLPDGSGLELAKQLRSIPGLKILALSGFGMDEDVARSKEAGFDGHLTKPVNVQILERTVRGLVG